MQESHIDDFWNIDGSRVLDKFPGGTWNGDILKADFWRIGKYGWMSQKVILEDWMRKK